ncbi:MAG: hypothetical protein OEZ36_03130 [Spirochaetota bacterium]|nr:hypothetical protein [Spirochaetota bacterium]
MTRRIYCVTVIITLSILLSQCSKELFKLDIAIDSLPQIPDMDLSYSLVLRETQERIGSSSLLLKHHIALGKVFYQLKSRLRLNWMDYSSGEKLSLLVESHSVVDHSFKLRSFNSILIRNNETIRASGYYSPPYFYVKENSKNARYRAPKGVFSSLVEQYLIRQSLKRPGDAAVYHFLNLATLGIEEERILHAQSKMKEQSQDTAPLMVFETVNYTHGYRSTYWVNRQGIIEKKTDFREAVIWHLDKPSEAD